MKDGVVTLRGKVESTEANREGDQTRQKSDRRQESRQRNPAIHQVAQMRISRRQFGVSILGSLGLRR